MAAPLRRPPHRIQRRRTRGATLPKAAVYVGRPTRWGNGWKIGEPHPDTGDPITRADAVSLYAAALAKAEAATLAIIREELRGRDLACWCRLDQACHADLLLVVANEDPAGTSLDLTAEPAEPEEATR